MTKPKFPMPKLKISKEQKIKDLEETNSFLRIRVANLEGDAASHDTDFKRAVDALTAEAEAHGQTKLKLGEAKSVSKSLIKEMGDLIEADNAERTILRELINTLLDKLNYIPKRNTHRWTVTTNWSDPMAWAMEAKEELADREK